MSDDYDLEWALLQALIPGIWCTSGNYAQYPLNQDNPHPFSWAQPWRFIVGRQGAEDRFWGLRAQVLGGPFNKEVLDFHSRDGIYFSKLLRTLKDGGFRKRFGLPPLDNQSDNQSDNTGEPTHE